MIVNKLGAAILQYSAAYKALSKENGVEDPYTKERKIKARMFYDDTIEFKNGSHIKCRRSRELTPEEKVELPTEEEKETYRRNERIYIATRICKEVGYNEFMQYATLNNCEWLLDLLYPCDAPDHQCNLFCKKQGECNYEND